MFLAYQPPRIGGSRSLTYERHAVRAGDGADHALPEDRVGVDDDDTDRFAHWRSLPSPIQKLAVTDTCWSEWDCADNTPPRASMRWRTLSPPCSIASASRDPTGGTRQISSTSSLSPSHLAQRSEERRVGREWEQRWG